MRVIPIPTPTRIARFIALMVPVALEAEIGCGGAFQAAFTEPLGGASRRNGIRAQVWLGG
jgi:hypothetical protein